MYNNRVNLFTRPFFMQLPPGSIIASGPVIIEDGKVLLNREKKPIGQELFMFPGGTVKDFSVSLEANCQRETKEEVGIEIKIIKPLRTILWQRPEDKIYIILVHYLAKRLSEVKPGADTLEWNWFDIKNLPTNCAPNVYEIINDYLKETV
ncbi:MAG: NUDIX hydrolase [Candidatus Magasanikbacteria bacterium]|nr:NUDIX hydrolase [Candidatus Magasanikbacteria bacterium]